MNLFNAVELAPRDPILGLNEAYHADTRTNKCNLGVGVYCNEEGRIPLLTAVKQAKEKLLTSDTPYGYLPIDGLASYNQAVQVLLFGCDSPLIADGKLATIQTLGGTGALKVGADFLKCLYPQSNVAISNPSWENHQTLFTAAGFNVTSYRYYDALTHTIDLKGLLEDLQVLPARSIVILHGCCHNPTGVDLNTAQWKQVLAIFKERQLIPFIDIAYQGFGEGIAEDAFVVRLFADSGLSFLVASSFSKSFSLYGERVGALTLVTQGTDETKRVLSQIKRVIRTNYSTPPTYGASLVSHILNTPHLRDLWEKELKTMRERIKKMRLALVSGLANEKQDFSFITQQHGMFSYSGLTAEQVGQLQQEFAIYALSTGRVCVAALNEQNIDYVISSIKQVV